jgi:hypothetical protein
MLSVTVIYDILRDGIGATPIVLVSVWLLLPVVVRWLATRVPPRSRGPSGDGFKIWLVWLALGAVGFGNVFYQHFRCRAAAAAGRVRVVQGAVTAYHPPDPNLNRDRETLTVSGQTWTYSTHDVGRGGYRGTPSANKLIGVGSPVRISSYDGRILKLELLDARPSPPG